MRWWLLVFLPLPLFADTISIADAVEIALANNYSIRLARNDEQKAQNSRKLKYGALLPTVRADGSMTYTNIDNNVGSVTSTSFSGSGESLIYTAGVAGNWTLFDGLRMFYAYKQVDQTTRFTEQASRHQIESSVAAVITAFYNLLASEAILAAAKHQLEVSRLLFYQLQTRLQLGGISKRVLLRQQVVVNTDSAAVSARRLELIQAQHTLNVTMGRSPGEYVVVHSDTSIVPPAHDVSYWFDRAKNHNAGLRMAEIRQHIAVSEYGIARSAFWPVLAANGSYSRSFGDNEQGRAVLGLTLRWPLFNGFKTLTASQNAVLDKKNAQLSFQKEYKELEALIFASWERQQNAFNQIIFERQAVQVAQQSLDVSREQFALGGISDVQLREAQLSLTQSRVRLQSALFLYKVTKTQLEQLAGTLRIK